MHFAMKATNPWNQLEVLSLSSEDEIRGVAVIQFRHFLAFDDGKKRN
jgi:hypothetical protein